MGVSPPFRPFICYFKRRVSEHGSEKKQSSAPALSCLLLLLRPLLDPRQAVRVKLCVGTRGMLRRCCQLCCVEPAASAATECTHVRRVSVPRYSCPQSVRDAWRHVFWTSAYNRVSFSPFPLTHSNSGICRCVSGFISSLLSSLSLSQSPLSLSHLAYIPFTSLPSFPAASAHGGRGAPSRRSLLVRSFHYARATSFLRPRMRGTWQRPWLLSPRRCYARLLRRAMCAWSAA